MERNPDIASILCQSLGPSLNQGSTETTSDCTQTTVIGSFYTEFLSYILWSFIRVSSLKWYSVLMWGDSPLKPSSTSPTSPSYSCALWGKKNTITFLNKRCVKRTASGHTFTSKCSFTPIPPTTKWKKRRITQKFKLYKTSRKFSGYDKSDVFAWMITFDRGECLPWQGHWL